MSDEAVGIRAVLARLTADQRGIADLGVLGYEQVLRDAAEAERQAERHRVYRAMYREQRRVMDAIAAAMDPSAPRQIVEASSAMDPHAARYVAETLRADLVVVDEALWDDPLRTVREIAARHLPEETDRAR